MEGKIGEKTFGDCAINKGSKTEVKQGRCQTKCSKVSKFLGIAIIFVFFNSMVEVPTFSLIRMYF